MRTVEYFKRMLHIAYIYAAKLMKPAPRKQLPAAEKRLMLRTKTED